MATVLYWQDPDSGQTEFVRFDAVLSEVHEDAVTITDHPVELGVNVSDHARPEPERLTIEAVVSNIPNLAIDSDADYEITEFSVEMMRDPGTKTITLDVPVPPVQFSPTGLLQAGVGAIVRAIEGPPKATVSGEPRRQTITQRARFLTQRAPRNRVRDVYELLLKAKENAVVITAQTAYREHFDMLIERIAQPRAAEDGSKARFEVDLRRIRVAESETVEAPRPAEARGQRTQNKGSQASKDDPSGNKKYRSTLKRIKDGAAEALSADAPGL